MISKKMRNISMVCLSFVLALTLAFGLASFSVKTADAAEYTNNIADATNVVESGETVTYTYPMLNSGKLKGNSFLFEVPSNTASATLKVVDNGSNSSRYCYVYPKGVATTTRNADEEAVKDSDVPGKWSLYSGSGKTHIFGFTKDDLLVNGDKTYIVIGSADDYKFKETFTVVATLEATKSIDSIEPLTGTYELMVGQDISVAGLPSEVTGNWTDANSATGTIAVPVTNWTADTSAVGTVVATGTLGAVDGYTLGVETVTANVTVKEIEKIEITSFEAIAPISATFGTSKDALGLPATVIGSNGDNFNVAWTIEPEFTGAVGNYTATGAVEYNETYYTVTAANPTVAIEITAISIASQELTGVYYTFDNESVVGLPATLTANDVDFEIAWNAYVADSATISGSLVAKTGYDVSNAQVTANVQKAVATKSITFINKEIPTTSDSLVVSGTWAYDDGLDGGNRNEGEVAQVFYEGIKTSSSNAGKLTFYLDKTSKVSFGYGARAMQVVNGNNEVVVSWDGGTTPANGAKTTAEVELTPGAYTISATGGNAFLKFINIINEDTTVIYGVGNSATLPAVAAEKADYTFIGWADGNKAIVANSVENANTGVAEYVAAYAKAEYLGVQFKTAGNGAIRFGFMISAVNAGDEAVALSADLLSDATFTFVNLSNGKSANLVPTTLAVGSDETNLYTNLAITGMDAAKSANVLTANLSIKVNGVAIEVNGSETESITAKAQKALEAGQLNEDQAGVYGA